MMFACLFGVFLMFNDKPCFTIVWNYSSQMWLEAPFIFLLSLNYALGHNKQADMY